jgi:hypothetical protein
VLHSTRVTRLTKVVAAESRCEVKEEFGGYKRVSHFEVDPVGIGTCNNFLGAGTDPSFNRAISFRSLYIISVAIEEQN